MSESTEKVISSLLKTINSKSDEKTKLLVQEVIEDIHSDPKLKLDNPEYFDTKFNNKLRKSMKLIANSLHKPSECKDKYKVDFIYLNYRFLENHIRELCILRQGSTCCADKSRYILNMYLNYAKTGEIPEFDSSIEKYYIPKFGDNQMWMNYCDSLYSLFYGRTEKYFKSYNELLHCKMRKFKHLLHTWYIELNDNSLIKFDNTWDDDTKNPLNNHYLREDFYIIHKNKVGDINFEKYTPADEEDDFLFEFYVKIPKCMVKRIYKETKEVYI